MLSGEATLEMEEFLEQPHIKAKIFKLTEKYDCEKPNGKSLILDFSELEKYSPNLADNLVKYPDIVLPIAKQTLEKIIMQIMGQKLKTNIRFKSLPPQYSTTVQKIGALHINTLTEFECVTNLVSDRLTQLQTAAFECQFCNQVSFKKPEKKQLKPMTNRCSCGHNTFVLKEDLSDYIDLQRAQSQELVERAHNPTATPVIELWLEDDLTNYLNAGEKVRITGVLRTRAKNLRDKDKNTIYSKYVDVVHIQKLEQDEEEFTITPEEEKEIIALSKNPKRDEILISSMAPYISGHGKIKEALLLQQFGGTSPNSSTYKRDVMHILIIGDPSCLVAGSRIVNSDGTFSKIESFGETHLQTINRNIMVDERTNASTTQFHKFSNQPLIEIITETGKSIVGTYNHPLRVLGDSCNSWKRLDEIKIGDKLETITQIPCTKTELVDTNFKIQRKRKNHKLKALIPNKVTPELAGLIGYVLGDGYVSKYVVGALVNLQEEDLIEKLNIISKNCFGKQFVINKRIFSNKLAYFKNREHPHYKKPIFECYLRGIDIAQNLIFLREKRVPDLIMQSRNDIVSEFLAWLFEADGCVFSHSDKERQIKGIQLRCGKQRIELLRDVQLLLLRFGIHSRILEDDSGAKLVIRRGKSIIAFDKNIGFKSKKKKEKLAAAVVCSKNVSRVIYNEIYERVVSIKQVGFGDVYDIHVPQFNSFIANGMISHNTSKSELTRFVAKMSPKLVSATGGGSSLEYNEPVYLKINNNIKIMKIGEFVENWILGKYVSSTVETASFNFNNYKIEWAAVSCGLKHELNNKRLFEVILETGRKVVITEDHSLFTLKNAEVVPISGRELKEKDFIVIPRSLPVEETNNLPSDLGRLLGYFIAEGNLHFHKSGTYQIAFTVNINDPFIEDINVIFQKYFNKKCSVYPHGKNGARLVIGGKQVFNKFKNMLGDVAFKHASEKRIPEIIFSSPLETKKEFLRGYFAGDGGCTSSKELMSDVIYLLSSLGYVGSCSRIFPPKVYPTINGRQIKSCHDAYHLRSQRLLLKSAKSALTAPFIQNEKYLHFPTLSLDEYSAFWITKNIKTNPTSKNLRKHFVKNLNKLKSGISNPNGRFYARRGLADVKVDHSMKKYKHGWKKIYFLSEYGEKVLKSREKLLKLFDSDCVSVRVKKITEIKPTSKYVYDLSVPMNENFVGGFGGIICHNSGVGLCASVEKDAEFGGWIIKAGAAVLANNGTMAIDEFDKLGDSDKGLLHSVMTDQVVVITKAGKNVQLPARTSVLAVCNPKFGRFDPNEPTLSQFNIGEALRTRFDLIFVTRDIAEEVRDDAIMQKIVDAYLPKEQRAISYNSEIISPEKIKKYIAYARKNCKPVITDNEIVQEAVAYFRELRKTQGEQTTTALPHRYFESIIRIAGAYAKKRLSNVIDKEDFTNAVLIMDNSLKQYLVDPQTGKLDANLGDFGKTTSQLNQQHMMVLEIRSMCGLSPDGLASEFEYEKACIERLGIPEPRYRTLFNSLKTVGEITQQVTGKLRYRR